MTDGYLSRDRAHLNKGQKARRVRLVRIDYMPGEDALAAIEAQRATLRPGSVGATNSAILDAIVIEWAEQAGINKSGIEAPMSSRKQPELSDASARANDSGDWMARKFRVLAANRRATCGARRHRDGQPCQAKSEPGKRRCRFHGGRSTGPKTPEGKVRALANLRQWRKSPRTDGGLEL